IALYPNDGSAQDTLKNITVRNNQIYNTGQDPDYGAAAGIALRGYVQNAFIEYNSVHDTNGAGLVVTGNPSNHYNVGPTNIHLRYNVVTNNTAYGAIRVSDGTSGQDPKDIKIYGNIAYNSTAAGGLVIGPDLGNTNSLLVYNNTFYNAPVN